MRDLGGAALPTHQQSEMEIRLSQYYSTRITLVVYLSLLKLISRILLDDNIVCGRSCARAS